jgi:hypothetical protein
MASKLHIDNWIAKAEPDYYTMFVKAWIPFNAWYFTEYNTKKDSYALEQIKTTRNKIRNRIESLLQNEDNDSRSFRYNLAQLHLQLENRTILNYGEQVSFKKIVLDGVIPQPVTDNDRKGNIYKAIPNKNTGYRAVIIDKFSRTLMDKTFNPYDMSAFITDTQYVALVDNKIQEKIRICFEQINPNSPIDLVSKSKIKSEYILLDTETKTQFVNDKELIAKAVIQILYTLRCLLFHGELDPTETNQPIYEYGFNILRTIIKELK